MSTSKINWFGSCWPKTNRRYIFLQPLKNWYIQDQQRIIIWGLQPWEAMCKSFNSRSPSCGRAHSSGYKDCFCYFCLGGLRGSLNGDFVNTCSVLIVCSTKDQECCLLSATESSWHTYSKSRLHEYVLMCRGWKLGAVTIGERHFLPHFYIEFEFAVLKL